MVQRWNRCFPTLGWGTRRSRSSRGGMRWAGLPRVFHPPRAVAGLAAAAPPVTAPCPPWHPGRWQGHVCPGGRVCQPARVPGAPAWGPSGNGAMLRPPGGIRGVSRAGRLPALLMHQCYRRFQSLRNLATDKILGVYCIFWQLLRK